MKREAKNSVGLTKTYGGERKIGIAYAVIPDNLKRSEYIENCFKTNTIAIKDERGYLKTKVPINQEILSQVEFPESPYRTGSPLVYGKEYQLDEPVILNVLQLNQKRGELEEEFQFLMRRIFGNNFVSIDGRAKQGTLSVDVSGEESSEMNLNLIHPDDEAKFDLFVKGFINLLANKDINLKYKNNIQFTLIDEEASDKAFISYKNGDGFELLDEFENKIKTTESSVLVEDKNGNSVLIEEDIVTVEANQKIVVKAPKVFLSGEENAQSVVLGDNLNNNLNTLIDINNRILESFELYIQNQSTAIASAPALAPLAPALIALSVNLNIYKSQYTFLKQQFDLHLSQKVETE